MYYIRGNEKYFQDSVEKQYEEKVEIDRFGNLIRIYKKKDGGDKKIDNRL